MTGYRALDFGSLAAKLPSEQLDVHYVIFGLAPFVSMGRTTQRLHLRHFNSTPSGTRRASRLPQQQRNDPADLVADPVLSSGNSERGCIYHFFRSLAIRSEVRTNAQSIIAWAVSVCTVG